MNSVPSITAPQIAAPPPVQRMHGIARKAFLLAAVFTAGIFIPALCGADMMQWGFAAAVFSGFLAMIALVTAVVYRRQARELSALFAGRDLLAVWTVPPAQWREAVQADWQEEKRDKRMLWYLVLGWCVVIGIVFLVMDPAAGGIVLLVLLGVAGICGFAAVLGARWRRRRQLESAGIVWIGRRGVYCGGMFHDWSLPGSSLRSVEALTDDAGSRILELTYDFVTRAGFQTETARVPVPPGHEEEALRIAEMLASRIS